MSLFRSFIAALLVVGMQPVIAADSNFDYDYVDIRISLSSLDGDGGIAGMVGVSQSLGDKLFVQVAYQTAAAFDVDAWQEDLYAGVGMHKSLGEQTDMIGTAGLLMEWVEYCAYYCAADDDMGLRLTGGVRHQVASNLELSGELELVAIFGEAQVGIIAGVQFGTFGLQFTARDAQTTFGVVGRF